MSTDIPFPGLLIMPTCDICSSELNKFTRRNEPDYKGTFYFNCGASYIQIGDLAHQWKAVKTCPNAADMIRDMRIEAALEKLREPQPLPAPRTNVTDPDPF